MLLPVISLALSIAVASIDVGAAMPALEGSYLNKKKAKLPDDCHGKVAMIAMGFTYDSRWAVEAWIKRFRETFGRDQSVTFYEVPVLSGTARLGRWFIDGSMRQGTPPELHGNVITVYGRDDEWKKRVGFREPNVAYLLIVDRDGVLRWKHHGPFDESAFRQLKMRVEELRR